MVGKQGTIIPEEVVDAESWEAEPNTMEQESPWGEAHRDNEQEELEQEVEQNPVDQDTSPENQRRYPLRNRIPKKYERLCAKGTGAGRSRSFLEGIMQRLDVISKPQHTFINLGIYCTSL